MDTGREAAVRKEAYLLWEKEGKPDGRETEFWMRAKVLVADKTAMDAVSKPAPKRAGKPSAAAAPKAAASKSKAAPSKAAKPKATTAAKPKKK